MESFDQQRIKRALDLQCTDGDKVRMCYKKHLGLTMITTSQPSVSSLGFEKHLCLVQSLLGSRVTLRLSFLDAHCDRTALGKHLPSIAWVSLAAPARTVRQVVAYRLALLCLLPKRVEAALHLQLSKHI